MNKYPTLRVLIADERDKNSTEPWSDLGEFATLTQARHAIDDYINNCGGLVAWQITTLYDDEVIDSYKKDVNNV
jgi:hypothetical protein